MSPFARRVWPAAAFQFCFVGALALLKPGANAVVLARYGAVSLPYLYSGSAAFTALLSVVSVAVPRQRLGPKGFAALGAIVSALTALGLWLHWPVVPLWAYVFAEVFGTAATLSFWAVLGDAFDALESRRAFTAISGIGMVGAVFGGLAAQVLAHLYGAPALVAAGAALLVGAALVFRWHKGPAVASAPKRKRPGSERPVWRYVLEGRYPRTLALVVLGFSVLSALSDFFFRARAGSALSEADLASIFGSLQLWTGVFSAFFQLAVAEVLLRRLGVVRYLLAMPAVWLGLAALATFVPAVWSAYALKLFEASAMFALLPVSVQLLYSALPDETRDGVRAAIDGFLRKGGLLLVGAALAALAPLLQGWALGFIVMGTAAALVAVLWRLKGPYLQMLEAKVSRVGAVKLDSLDERVIGQALRATDPERALRALDLLLAARVDVLPYLRTLLTHPHERVRERGVILAEQRSAVREAGVIEALIRGTDRRPRDAAAMALATLDPTRAKEVLPPLMQSSDFGLRAAAVGALLSLDAEAAAPRKALEDMLYRMRSSPAPERRAIARLLGRLKDERYASALAKAIDDADPTVRAIAIRSVGLGGYLSLAPRLLRFLAWRDERRAAREALERLGDKVVPLVATALDDRSRAVSLRYQLPRVLRQIATQSALDALLFSNAQDDAFLHYRVGAALARLKDAKPKLRVDRRQVLGALERRRELYRELLPRWRVLKASLGPNALLTRGLQDRLDQAFELSLLLLGLLHGDRLMRRVHAQLRGNEAKGRAWAREFLDHKLAPDERELLLEQLERHHQLMPPGDANQAPKELAFLCRSGDAVLRALARHVARQRGVWPLELKEDDMSDETVRRLFALEGVEIFAESDVDDLAAIAAVAKEQSFRPGERVYAEGDPGDALYVVIEGVAEARRAGELMMRFKAREAFGEVSLFDGAPRVTDIVAVEPLKVLVMDRRDFLDVLSDRPELLAGVFRVLSRQLKSVLVELSARRTTGEAPIVMGPPVRVR